MEIRFQIVPYLVCICIPAVRLLMQSMQLLSTYPQCKADYCDTCIEKFMTTANYVFCIEFQDRKLMLNHVRRQNG